MSQSQAARQDFVLPPAKEQARSAEIISPCYAGWDANALKQKILSVQAIDEDCCGEPCYTGTSGTLEKRSNDLGTVIAKLEEWQEEFPEQILHLSYSCGKHERS